MNSRYQRNICQIVHKLFTIFKTNYKLFAKYGGTHPPQPYPSPGTVMKNKSCGCNGGRAAQPSASCFCPLKRRSICRRRPPLAARPARLRAPPATPLTSHSGAGPSAVVGPHPPRTQAKVALWCSKVTF
jgi:hypothetical protein